MEYLYYSDKYSDEKKELLRSAIDNYDKAITLRGSPEDTDQEYMETQIRKLNAAIELLESVVFNPEQVLDV